MKPDFDGCAPNSSNLKTALIVILVVLSTSGLGLQLYGIAPVSNVAYPEEWVASNHIRAAETRTVAITVEEGKTKVSFEAGDILAFFAGLVAFVVAVGAIMGRVSENFAYNVIIGLLGAGGISLSIVIVVKRILPRRKEKPRHMK